MAMFSAYDRMLVLVRKVELQTSLGIEHTCVREVELDAWLWFYNTPIMIIMLRVVQNITRNLRIHHLSSMIHLHLRHVC